MAINIGVLEAYLRLKDELTPALTLAGQRLQQAGDRLEKLGQSAQRAGSTLTQAITLPLGAAAAGAFKFSKDFETAMTRVETLTGTSRDVVAGMREEVLKLAPAVGIGPEKLAEALLVVSSTGIKGKQAMDVLTAAAQATTVGLGDTKDIARAVTAAMTAYGVENLSAAEATAKLFVAVREGGAEATEFAGTLGRIVGIAQEVGVSFDEVLASIATFTRLGVNADEAVTALRGTLSTFLKPSKQARDQLNELGTSADEVRKSIRERGLAETLIDLVRLTKGNDEALSAIIPNVRALAGVLGTAGAQSGAYRDGLLKIKNATTDFDEAVKRTADTTGQKWNQFLAAARVGAIQMGDALSESFTKLLESGTKFIDDVLVPAIRWFTQLPAGVQQTVFAIGALGVALGPVLFVFGQILSVGGLAAKAIGSVGSVAGLAVGGVLSLKVALLALVAGVILGGLYLLYTRMRDVGKASESLSGQPLKGLTDSTGKAVLSIEQANRKLAELQQATGAAGNGMHAVLPTVNSLGQSLIQASKAANDNNTALGGGVKVSEELGAAYRELTNWIEERRLADEGAALAFQTSAKHLDVMSLALAVNTENLMRAANAAKGLTHDGLIPMNEELQESITKMAMGAHTTHVLSDDVSTVDGRMEEWHGTLNGLSRAFEQLANISGDTFSSIARDIGSAVASFQLASKSATLYKDTLKDIDDNGMTKANFASIAAAIMGMVAALDQATASGSRTKRVLSGAASGAMAGSAFGPWGAAIGAGVGALVGVFRGNEGKQLNDIRDEWIKTIAGTSDNLRQMMGDAGATEAQIRALFDSRNLKDFGIAQEAILDLLDKHKDAAAQAGRAQEEANRIAAGTFGTLTGSIDIYQAKLANTDAIRKFRDELREVQTGGTADLRILFSELETLKSSIGNTPEIQALEEALIHAAETGTFEFDKFELVLKLLGDTFGVTYENMRQDTFRLTAAQRELQAEFQKTFIANRTTAPNNNDLLSPAAFRTFEDWSASWLSRNQGEQHRLRSALGGEWQAHWGPKPPGFATGTPGLGFMDFGAGKLIAAHGREAIVPKGREEEFAARHAPMTDLQREVSGLRADIRRLMRDQPRAIGLAIQDALVLGGAR